MLTPTHTHCQPVVPAETVYSRQLYDYDYHCSGQQALPPPAHHHTDNLTTAPSLSLSLTTSFLSLCQQSLALRFAHSIPTCHLVSARSAVSLSIYRSQLVSACVPSSLPQAISSHHHHLKSCPPKSSKCKTKLQNESGREWENRRFCFRWHSQRSRSLSALID